MELISGWGDQICKKCRKVLSQMLWWLPVEVWQVSLAEELPGAVMPHGTLPIGILKLTTNCSK